MEVGSSNVETPGGGGDLNVEPESENLTIMTESAEVLDGLDNSGSGPESGNLTIMAKYVRIIPRCLQIRTVKNHFCGFLTSKDPKIKIAIQKFKYAAQKNSIEKLKRDTSRTDGISDDVFDDIRSIIGSSASEGSTSSEGTEDSNHLEDLKEISIDFKKRPPDGVESVSGNHFKYFKTKKGFGVFELLEDGKVIFYNLRSPEDKSLLNYGTHVLLYQKCEMSLVVMLFNDLTLITLERINWDSDWVKIPTKFDFRDLEVVKNKGEVASKSEFAFEFYEHFMKIFIPFLAKKIMYKKSLVFLDNNKGEYPFCLSIDLLTGKEQLHPYSDISDLVQTKFQLGYFGSGYQLSEEEKPAEMSCTNYIYFIRRGSLYLANNLKAITYWGCRLIMTYKIFRKLFFYFAIILCKHVKIVNGLLKDELTKSELDRIMRLIWFDYDTLDVNERESPYIKQRYHNFRTYQAIDDILFDEIVEEKNVLWTVKKDGKYPKLVNFYFEGNEKWLIIVVDDNTLEVHYKSSDSEKFIDVSKLMFNIRDLKVIKRNRQELSIMDLTPHFRCLFCTIPLGDVVSVSYKDRCYDLTGYGDDLLVFLVYDILGGEVYLLNMSFKM